MYFNITVLSFTHVWVLVDGIQLEEGEGRNEKVHEDPIDGVALVVVLDHVHDLLAKIQERVNQVDEAEDGCTDLGKSILEGIQNEKFCKKGH